MITFINDEEWWSQMKALILLADNIYLTPYLKFYTDIFQEMNIKYKIVFWDKNNTEFLEDEVYKRYCYETKFRLMKILGYIKYKKYINHICKKENFDIILPLQPIISFLCSDILIKKYKRKYIYDIRDYSYEKFFFYRWIEKKLVNNSTMNIISSEGYKKFLPKGKYYITHNIPRVDFTGHKQLKNPNGKINLSYIGLIRFMDQNKRIIDFFKNDKRFHLNFIGTNAKQLKEYCIKNGVNNVTLIDTFDPKETLKYYDKTDAIMNLYGNNTPLLDYALSNKLYYAACLYKPILVCADTFMEQISSKNGLGFTVRMKSEKEKEDLYNWLTNMNRNEFMKNCDSFMENVYVQEKKLDKELRNKLLHIEQRGKK